MQLLLKFLQHHFSLRQIVYIGFAIVLAMLALVSIHTFVNLAGIKTNVNQVINESQPQLLKTMQLVNHIKASSNALSSYLLSKNPQYKNNYESNLNSAQKIISTLKNIHNLPVSMGMIWNPCGEKTKTIIILVNRITMI